MKKLLLSVTFLALLLAACAAQSSAASALQDSDPSNPEAYNVVWDTNSNIPINSMPLGNGDTGINVWTEDDGDLLIYIGKTDAFDESGRLLKLGRLRIHYSGNPFGKEKPFKQELLLRDGMIHITGGEGPGALNLLLWVDAYRDVIHVESESKTPFDQTVALEVWRTQKVPLKGWSAHGVDGGLMPGMPPMQFPDTIVDTAKLPGFENHLIWYHRNLLSIYPVTLKVQGLDGFASPRDPLLNRTFGGAIFGENFVAQTPTLLKTRSARNRTDVTVVPLTAQTPDIHGWFNGLQSICASAPRIGDAAALAAHRKWWAEFWKRSWVRLSGGDPKETGDITRGWYLNRFITACAARGGAPIKFNGTIFNVGTIDSYGKPSPDSDADSRAWGPAFWNQNERHIYWPMLQAGDYEQLLPFFKMYRDALPLAKYRTRRYYGHDGAFFPETMYFWGTYLNNGDLGYGGHGANTPIDLIANGHTQYHWQGGLEATAMMLEYYRHTCDENFLRQTLLPMAEQVLTFYDEHYKRGPDGKILIEPAHVLETYWDVTNPMPEIAGLNCCIDGLLALPPSLTTAEQRARWKRILAEVPPLPMSNVGSSPVLVAAGVFHNKGTHNGENGNLYALWPYNLIGVASGNLKLAQDSYHNRLIKGAPYQSWTNDTIFAAYAGLAGEATDHLAYRFVMSGPCRFPSMYCPGDWIPDIQNGGVCQNTIQDMLMQTSGRKIVLLPAWPKRWNCDFKLHAPGNTTVEGRVENGQVVDLKIVPKSRGKDVEIWADSSFGRRPGDYGRDVSANGAKVTTSSTLPGTADGQALLTDDCSAPFAFHTGNDVTPWVTIDLGKETAITGVLVRNRADCCQDRAKTLQVRVSDDGKDWREVWRATGAQQTWEISLLDKNIRGRYVRLETHPDQPAPLHLQHVEIWGKPAPNS